MLPTLGTRVFDKLYVDVESTPDTDLVYAWAGGSYLTNVVIRFDFGVVVWATHLGDTLAA